MSDLAQEILKIRASANDWVIVTHPRKEHLPSELFAPLPSQKVAQEVLPLMIELNQIARKTYLPTEYAESLNSKVLKRSSRAVRQFEMKLIVDGT